MSTPRGPKPRPVADRLWEKVEKTDTCWLWRGATNNRGYGQMVVGSLLDGSKRKVLVHRLSYELLVGPIPEGLVIDHVRNRGCTHQTCVNPAHLEAVTQRENLRRGDGGPGINARKTHCKRGHPFDDGNTYRTSKGRHCKVCRREALRRYRQRSLA